jgi:hypothetical protein
MDLAVLLNLHQSFIKQSLGAIGSSPVWCHFRFHADSKNKVCVHALELCIAAIIFELIHSHAFVPDIYLSMFPELLRILK